MRNKEGLLERSVSGVKNFGKSIKNEVTSKAYWVDTLAGQSFWLPLLTLNERYVQEFFYGDGSTWDEIGDARLVGFGMGILANRSFSKLRDYWARRVFDVNKDSSKLRRNSADLALALLLVPGTYSLTLGLAGESFGEILQMVPSGSVIQLGMALGYAKYLDKARDVFGTTPDYLLKDSD